MNFFFVPHISQTNAGGDSSPETLSTDQKMRLRKTVFFNQKIEKGKHSTVEHFWKITALLQPKLTDTHTHTHRGKHCGPTPLSEQKLSGQPRFPVLAGCDEICQCPCWGGVREWALGYSPSLNSNDDAPHDVCGDHMASLPGLTTPSQR